MYEWFSSCRERFVENSVESVETHPKKRRQRWTFARSPQSFQLVEKSQAIYGMYRHILWKTFCFGKTAEMRRAARAAGKTFLQLPCPAGKLRFTEKILGVRK